MSLTKDLHESPLASPLLRGTGSHTAVAPPSRGILDLVMRVPLSAKLLGANLLVALIALAALWLAHTPRETTFEILAVPAAAVVFVLVANVVLVTVALRPLRELERTAQRVWAGDLSVRARASQTEDTDLGRVRSAINLLLDGMNHDRMRMRRLALHAITVGDKERALVGRELHESSAQWLAGLTLELSAFAKTAEDPARREQLLQMQATARQVMEQVRALSETLHPRVLDDLGLPAALQHLARKTTERGLSTSADTMAASARLPAHVASVLYDVAREAVTNALLHAEAGHADILLTTGAGRAQLAVHDDGRGMDVGEAQRSGFGLFAMRERIALVNGTFELESRPGDGTRVVATVALTDEDGQ